MIFWDVQRGYVHQINVSENTVLTSIVASMMTTSFVWLLKPWGQAIITLVRSLVTPQLLKEKLSVMLDSAWKTISKSQTDGELASLFKSCWIEIFKNDRATRDNVALMIEIGGDIAIKTFHSRGKEALVGFKTRTCGRGAQKDSMALRTRLKCATGDDNSMVPDKEKLTRQKILCSSQQKAMEVAVAGKTKRNTPSGRYKTIGDNEKDDRRTKMARILFSNNTTTTQPPHSDPDV